jgi:hypothetical protein
MSIKISISLAERYGAAFGYIAANGIDGNSRAIVKNNLDLFEIGDKTFADLELTSTQTGESYRFANTQDANVLGASPMFTLTRKKKLVITNIDNSDFEVVESFGNKSWEITIEGLLIDNENHNYPQNKCKKVAELFNTNSTYKVVCSMLNEIGINEIYFEELNDFNTVPGFNDTVKFKLAAKSTDPIEYTI